MKKEELYHSAFKSDVFKAKITKTGRIVYQFFYVDENDLNQHSPTYKTKKLAEEAFIKFHQDRHYELMSLREENKKLKDGLQEIENFDTIGGCFYNLAKKTLNYKELQENN